MTSASFVFLAPDDTLLLVVRALAITGDGVVGAVSVLEVATNI
jgi:hypothetical protein